MSHNYVPLFSWDAIKKPQATEGESDIHLVDQRFYSLSGFKGGSDVARPPSPWIVCFLDGCVWDPLFQNLPDVDDGVEFPASLRRLQMQLLERLSEVQVFTVVLSPFSVIFSLLRLIFQFHMGHSHSFPPSTTTVERGEIGRGKG